MCYLGVLNSRKIEILIKDMSDRYFDALFLKVAKQYFILRNLNSGFYTKIKLFFVFVFFEFVTRF